MTTGEYLRQILATLPEISRQTGYSTAFLAWQFFRCYLSRRTEIDEFRSLRLFEYAAPARNRFLTWKESKRISDRLTKDATEDELQLLLDKHLFNKAFSSFIRRDWLYLPETSPDQLTAFLQAHDVILAKSCVSNQGKNIFRFRRGDPALTDFLRENAEDPFLLEACIIQHPALQAINPGSVNTIRFIAAQKDQRVCFVGAGLRCGGAGQFVDNFHHGGVAYPIDLDSGVITGPGIDLDGNPILRHPTTGYLMPGFEIPFWEEVLDTIRRAALTIPHVGYVGWDLAITSDGVELIEGNVNYPGNTIIQLDGPGARQRLTEFVYAHNE